MLRIMEQKETQLGKSTLRIKDADSHMPSESKNPCTPLIMPQAKSDINDEKNPEAKPTNQIQSVVRHKSSLTNSAYSQSRGEIKSVVRVKDPTLDFSPLMTLLQPSTDLNKPPTNWLRRRPSQHQKHSQKYFWPKPISRYM